MSLKIMKLSEFQFECDIQADRKEYQCYRDDPASGESPVYLLVSLARLREALRGDSLWADTKAHRDDETFKPWKYERAVSTLAAGEDIYTPWLIFREGRIRVMDGRHRLYALIDHGFTHARVVTDPWHAPAARTLVEREDGGPGDSGRQEYLDAKAAGKDQGVAG